MRRLAFVGVVFGLFSAVALSDPSHQIVQALEQLLRRDVTNPKDANGVHIRIVPASSDETAKGKLRLVEIVSKPAKIKGVFLREFRGLAVEPVVNVQALLKEGKLKTVSVKESVVEGVMDAESLEQMFAQGKSTSPMNIQVQITDDGRAVLRGKLNLLRIPNPFEAICRVEPGKDGLYVRIDELKVNGVPAPGFLRSKLEEKVNPIVERDDLPFHPEIKTVRIHHQIIYINHAQPKDRKGAGQ